MDAKIGVYVCHCGTNISQTVDVEELIQFASSLPAVVVARDYRYMCSDPGQEMIKTDIAQHELNRVVVASCSPLMHETTFRRVCREAGLNQFLFQMANIREQVSWVTEDTGAGTRKAKRVLSAAVRRVAEHEPLQVTQVPVHPAVLVVGGGIAGMEAALRLADAGKQVYLVEREPTIGGHMAQFDKTFPTLDCAACILTPKMVAVGQHPDIRLLSYAEVEEVSGYVGNFKVRVRQKARYVDVGKCTGCGECVEECPAEVPSEFDLGLAQRKAIYRPFPQAVPNAFVIDKRDDKSPCKVACPAGVNAHGYVALVGRGKFKEALALIKQKNPFPAICGRVCHHPCEDECLRGKVDEPVAIAALKRFVADHEFRQGMAPPPEIKEKRPQKVAVIGSGPAGLTAAYDLALMGYGVTIFEALSIPGGMLSVGIPEYRLPKGIIRADIDYIKGLGVEIITDTPIGKDITLRDLLERGFDAVLVAVGASLGRMLNIPGADLKGVLNGLDFLRDVNLGKEVKVEGHVVVIGGGNVAMDVARTAVRLRAPVVRVCCLESREEMPAHKWQVAATEAEVRATEAELLAINGEATRIHCRLSPTRVLGENGKVTGVEFVRVKRMEFDEEGRLSLETEPGTERVMHADTVIIAVGQATDRSVLEGMGLGVTSRGTVDADPLTLETNLPGVFAAGDLVLGPSLVVKTIATGHEAAISIDRYLRGEDLRAGREPVEIKTVEVPRKVAEIQARAPMPEAPVMERIHSFDEVELGFTEETAIREAERCLDCEVCSECLECEKACEAEAVNHQMQEEHLELEVGSIILATGFDAFDCSQVAALGYGRFDNVITGLEFERLSHASGPTGGKILLKDGREPESVALLHCVGSRDENYNSYCSRVCCMYALKMAHLVREKVPQARVYQLYIDMRAFGKGYEEFYHRLLREDVVFIRGKGAQVTDYAESPEERGRLIVKCEDTLLGVVRRIPVDMVVLAAGLVARADAGRVGKLFSIARSADGFFLEKHPKLAPVATSSDGIFLAGACQGPKDIPDSVAQGAAAAAEALAMLDRGSVEIEPITCVIDEKLCAACKVCIEVCPYSAIQFSEEKKISVVTEALCKGCGICVAACPSGAAMQQGFKDRQIFAEIEGALVA